MKIYKVWLHVEEYDEEADTFTDVTAPVQLGPDFEELENALSLHNEVQDNCPAAKEI